MSTRAHLCLRFIAVALLVCAALWPRTRGAVTAAELGRSARERAVAHGTGPRARTAAAKLVSAPGSAKVVVAQADDSDLTN